MTQKVEINFASQSFNYPARQVASQVLRNWYVLTVPEGKSSNILVPFPGSKLFANDSNNHSVRGGFSLNGILYCVVDNEFRIYDDNGNYRKAGTMNTSVGRCSIIANDTQIFISDGANGYVYQLVESATRKAEDFFRIEEATSFISRVTFDGAGLNDMAVQGPYIGSTSKSYKVEIDSAATPDTFRWSDSGGITWNASNIPITAAYQNLNDGLAVSFVHTTGHTNLDIWEFDTTVDNSFYVPLIPAYLDTYGIYVRQNSKRFYISSNEDFSVVNALDFANANSFPDNIVVGVSINQELFLFCEYTTEIWYDTGAEEFPLQRRPNLLINYGCSAPYSLSVGSNNVLFWVGQNKNGGRSILGMENYTATVISNDAMNAELQEMHDISDAYGYVIEMNGITFYYVTFPLIDKTYVYNLSAKRWSERSTRRPKDYITPKEYIDGRFIGNCHMYHGGKHLVGSFNSGKIYELNQFYAYDDTSPVICECVTAVFQNKLDYVTVYSLQIDFEAATSNSTGDFSDAQVMFQYSKDGGYTWSKELWRPIGKTGEYKNRVKWNQLGTSRNWMFKVRVSDPVYRVLIMAIAEVVQLGGESGNKSLLDLLSGGGGA